MLGASFVLIFGLIFCSNIWSLFLMEFQNPLGISWMIRITFILIRQFLGGSSIAHGRALFARNTKPWLEAWKFQPYPLSSREERRTGKGFNHWSRLCDEASIKIPLVWGSESCQVGSHMEVWEERHVLMGCGSSMPLPHALLYAPLLFGGSSASFIILFIINW